MYKKIKIYIFFTLTLASISTLLYIASFFSLFDVNIGYFNTGLLTSVIPIILLLTTLLLITLFKTFSKSDLSDKTIIYSLRTRGIALCVALICLLSSIYRLFNASTNQIYSNITLICTVIGILSSIYFFSVYFRHFERYLVIITVSAISPILFSTFTIIEAHINPFITMNSPIKISLMLSMMSIMLFMLYEIRSIASCHRPRCFIFTSLLAVLLTSSFSVPYIVAYFANKIPQAEKTLFPAALFAFSILIYILSRIFDMLIQSQTINDN